MLSNTLRNGTPRGSQAKNRMYLIKIVIIRCLVQQMCRTIEIPETGFCFMALFLCMSSSSCVSRSLELILFGEVGEQGSRVSCGESDSSEVLEDERRVVWWV